MRRFRSFNILQCALCCVHTSMANKALCNRLEPFIDMTRGMIEASLRIFIINWKRVETYFTPPFFCASLPSLTVLPFDHLSPCSFPSLLLSPTLGITGVARGIVSLEIFTSFRMDTASSSTSQLPMIIQDVKIDYSLYVPTFHTPWQVFSNLCPSGFQIIKINSSLFILFYINIITCIMGVVWVIKIRTDAKMCFVVF